MFKNIIYIILLATFFSSCDLIEYHPNQVIVEDDLKDLNAKNIKLIKEEATGDTVRFALFGDTQRFYEETNEFVQKVNSMPEIDFAVLAGDITDFGLNTEYKWINEIISALNMPYVTVIGNHDLVANGQKIYEKMYGPLNFSFDLPGHKFIALNTNSREFGFNGRVPDLDWLERKLDSNPENKKIIVVSHIPPYSVDFDENLEEDYASKLARNGHVLASLHAHDHSYEKGEYYDDGIYYFITTTVGKKSFALITVYGDNLDIEKVPF
ncbi:MAG: metallophosphoesterase family protein [Candidatus Cyclobacteriaceae bacterium M2_1C_046]